MEKHLEIDEIFGVIDLWGVNAMRSHNRDGASVYNPYNGRSLSEALYKAGYRKTICCKNLTEYNPVDEFICSECGFRTEYFSETRVDRDDGDITYHLFEIKYCPNCGAKVVEE